MAFLASWLFSKLVWYYPSRKGNEYQTFSISISGPSPTPYSLYNLLILLKDIKKTKHPQISLKASNLSESNTKETISSKGQKESSTYYKIKIGPIININKKNPSKSFIKQNQIQQSTLSPYNPKARASIIPAQLKHKALVYYKIIKL
ncbi:unnamed protein product [Penicillium salamii]|nr:unnamed protein product [Penicillium salamii]